MQYRTPPSRGSHWIKRQLHHSQEVGQSVKLRHHYGAALVYADDERGLQWFKCAQIDPAAHGYEALSSNRAVHHQMFGKLPVHCKQVNPSAWGHGSVEHRLKPDILKAFTFILSCTLKLNLSQKSGDQRRMD